MTLETFIQLASGAGGAIVVLIVGFVWYVRAISGGTLVPGRYYDELVKDNEYLRHRLYDSIQNTDRTVETIEQIVPAARPPRGRRE